MKKSLDKPLLHKMPYKENKKKKKIKYNLNPKLLKDIVRCFLLQIFHSKKKKVVFRSKT